MYVHTSIAEHFQQHDRLQGWYSLLSSGLNFHIMKSLKFMCLGWPVTLGRTSSPWKGRRDWDNHDWLTARDSLGCFQREVGRNRPANVLIKGKSVIKEERHTVRWKRGEILKSCSQDSVVGKKGIFFPDKESRCSNSSFVSKSSY